MIDPTLPPPVDNPVRSLMRWISPDPMLGFESRVYLQSAFWTSLFGPAILVVNLGPVWPWYHTGALVLLALVNFAFFALARWRGRFAPFAFILANALMAELLWAFNQAALGSITFYFIAPFLYAILLLRGRRRLGSIVVSLGLFTGGFVADAAFPGWSDALFRYPDRNFAIADMYTGLVSALLIVAITMRVLVKNFDVERNLTDQKIRELSLLASTDSLTKLSNRDFVKDKLEGYLAQDGGSFPFSVILADIDHFKEVNDLFGHLTGDEVLREVATTFRQVVRKTDDVGRYGGEEFIVLLPLTSLDEAVKLAEKIRVKLQGTDFGLKPPFPVTASFGVAEYRPGEGLEDLVGRADDGLYRAKALGRNRVLAGAIRDLHRPEEP